VHCSGGFSTGAKCAGYDPVLAVDMEKKFLAVHKANHTGARFPPPPRPPRNAAARCPRSSARACAGCEHLDRKLGDAESTVLLLGRLEPLLR